ncbi:hypothetical protein [Sphingorhabdus sp. Alg231-15]|uniref:hypothetical protein n=1 Tax=Sphingorhabdus sp. Alg231-15 TaxID=1922222 RepID=UPI00307CC0E4
MISLFALFLVAPDDSSINRQQEVYWECNHSLSDANVGHFRGAIFAIVELDGKIRSTNFRFIDRPTQFHFKPVKGLPAGNYQLNYIYGGNIKLPFAPNQPLWLFHYADEKLIKQELNYNKDHVKRKQTRADAYVDGIRGNQVLHLEESENWLVKAILQDGTVIAEFERKTVSWQSIRADQNNLKKWVQMAASEPKKYCWYSTPDTRWERELSVTN